MEVSREMKTILKNRIISANNMIIGLLLILLVINFMNTQKSFKILTVNQLSIIDKTNKPRVVLKVDTYGSPWLSFYDINSIKRLEIKLHPDGTPAVKFYDKKGVTRAVLGTTSTGAPYILLYHKDGIDRIFIVVDSNGQPSIHLLNAKGQFLFKAP